ncbi:MAG: hypothetical protein JRI23_27595 [Deltaproteobacteria bacterium]|jgi:hypothetical protein|nr:hypothetical protein [Deltaproteobacteria bacterium]MBW2535845.1 hypothetical protein [Deltaproteobacteria bacterium]
MRQSYQRWFRVGVVGIVALGCQACAPVDLEGRWVGTWRATLWADDGGMTLDLTQDGDEVEGTFDLSGTVCVGEGRVDGSVDGRQFDATLSNGVGGEVVLDGRVNAASDRIDGNFEVTSGWCDNATGRFDVKLQ